MIKRTITSIVNMNDCKNYINENIVVLLAILGFITPLLVLLWKFWGKSIKSFLAKYINDDFDKHGVLLLSSLMATLPFLIPTLTIRYGYSDLVKTSIPILTFVLGQYITMSQNEKDKSRKDVALGCQIYFELEKNLNIINGNLKRECLTNLEALDLKWWDENQLYFDTYFSETTTFRKNNVTMPLKLEISKTFRTLFEIDNQIKIINQINNQKIISQANLADLFLSQAEFPDLQKLCKLQVEQLMEVIRKLYQSTID